MKLENNTANTEEQIIDNMVTPKIAIKSLNDIIIPPVQAK